MPIWGPVPTLIDTWHFDAVRGPSTPSVGPLSLLWPYGPHLLQSSSSTRVTAGAAGFLTLIQSADRPDRYDEPSRFDTMPSRRNTVAPRGEASLIVVWEATKGNPASGRGLGSRSSGSFAGRKRH